MSEWLPRVGDRVEYSPYGLRKLNPRAGQRRGVISGKGSRYPTCVKVLWDGLKMSSSYATVFLQPETGAALGEGRCPVHDRIIALAREGKTVREIADEVGRVHNAIYPVLRKAGVVPARPALKTWVGSWWTADKIAELRFCWESGFTCSQIAKQLGCSRNAVIGKAHRLKLSCRRSPIKRAA